MANYTNPHKFNIVLNSKQSATPANNVNNKSYYFNWSNIPDRKYQMTFSYRGNIQINATGSDHPCIFLNMGSTPSCYQANGTSGASIVSSFIGSLQTTTHINADLYYFCSQYDNPPVFFESVPRSDINVSILDDDFLIPFMVTVGPTALSDYVIILHFEEII